MKNLPAIAISAAFGLCATTTGLAAPLTYKTEAEYNSLIKTGRTSLIGYSETGGIGNGSSFTVDAAAGATNALYMTAPERLISTAPITVSLNFQWTTPTVGGGIGGHTFMLGFGSNKDGATLTPFTSGYTEGATDGQNRQEIYVGLKSGGVAGTNTVNITGGTVSNASNTVLSGLPATTATLVTGNWYFFTATFTPNAEETGFGINYLLYQVDTATGNLVGTALLDDDFNVSYAGVFTDTVNPFLSIRGYARTGISTIDNLTFAGSAIPEPSTVAALLSGALVLIGGRFHRRSRESA